MGLPANWIVVDIVRLENGRLAEHWDVICSAPGPDCRPASQSRFTLLKNHHRLGWLRTACRQRRGCGCSPAMAL
jgi:hypothetical protein